MPGFAGAGFGFVEKFKSKQKNCHVLVRHPESGKILGFPTNERNNLNVTTLKATLHRATGLMWNQNGDDVTYAVGMTLNGKEIIPPVNKFGQNDWGDRIYTPVIPGVEQNKSSGEKDSTWMECFNCFKCFNIDRYEPKELKISVFGDHLEIKGEHGEERGGLLNHRDLQYCNKFPEGIIRDFIQCNLNTKDKLNVQVELLEKEKSVCEQIPVSFKKSQEEGVKRGF